MLHAAGLAINALTKSSSSVQDDKPTQALKLEQQKEDFTAATSQYFSLISSVDVRLRRQIYALEEAEIIPAEAATKESQVASAVPAGLAALASGPNAASAKQALGNKNGSTGGGLGSLDVGWLNSRNGSVGKEMEAELWAKSESFVKRLERTTNLEAHDIDHLNRAEDSALLES